MLLSSTMFSLFCIKQLPSLFPRFLVLWDIREFLLSSTKGRKQDVITELKSCLKLSIEPKGLHLKICKTIDEVEEPGMENMLTLATLHTLDPDTPNKVLQNKPDGQVEQILKYFCWPLYLHKTGNGKKIQERRYHESDRKALVRDFTRCVLTQSHAQWCRHCSGGAGFVSAELWNEKDSPEKACSQLVWTPPVRVWVLQKLERH